ncbi:hypothetical protein WOLCODRAFT_90083 [Wolfiporia cocos MD-104 SS10]|uniref:SMP domain-containing protein n=1 Tax=Wolfiporia cocos (strain MD-104) TaxID=742152 RepID=A0A2H3JSU2_WOLCO|nr:hypothetical protein WOLCODRAFT_90083 [Wolfiporia cocos MD-104 SS10]
MLTLSASPAAPSLTVVTADVPLVSGDILRSTNSSAVSPTNSSSSTSSKRRGSVAEAVGLDLDAIGKGFSASAHPTGRSPPSAGLDPLKLKELARQDAARILAERKTNIDPVAGAKPNGAAKAPRLSPPTGGVNLSTISAAEARTLMSHEHRALGFRPPPGSLAAEAQAAAAKHPEGAGASSVDSGVLKEIALRDAERIKADRELNIVGEVNVDTLGKAGAERLASATENVLGHSPPPGSLAAEAKQAAEAHPNGGSFPVLDGDVERLEDVGRQEGERLKAQETVEKLKSESEEVHVEDVSTLADDLNALKLGSQLKHENGNATMSPEKLTMKNGIGAVLRKAAMVRSETGDSVEIIGDVIG